MNEQFIRVRALGDAGKAALDVRRDVGDGPDQAGARRACDEIARRISIMLAECGGAPVKEGN